MTAASSAMYHTTKQLAIQPTHKRNSSAGTSSSPIPRRMSSHSPSPSPSPSQSHPPLMPSKSSQALISPSAAKKAEKQQRALALRQRKAEIKSGIGLVQMNILTRPQTPRVMLSGYLKKMSTGHTWSEVYLLLSTLSLHCFQPVSTTHTITQLLEDELWHIPIHHCIVHHNCEDERKFAITTKQATVVLRAATKQDAWIWRSSIKEVKRAYLSHHTITYLTTAATSLRCVTIKEEEKEIVVGKGVTWNTPINIKDVSPDAILHAELMNGGTLSIPLAQLLQTGECTLQFDNTAIATHVLIRWETHPSTSTPSSSSTSTSSPDTSLPHAAILVLFDLIIPVVFFLVALYIASGLHHILIFLGCVVIARLLYTSALLSLPSTAKAISSLTPPQQAVNQRYDTIVTFVNVSHDNIEGISTSTSTSPPTSAAAPLSISVPSSTTTSPLASSSSVDTATFASQFFPMTPPSIISMRHIPSETHSEPTTGYHTPRQQHIITSTPTHGETSQYTSHEEPMDGGSSKGSKHKSSSSTSTSSSSSSSTISTSSSTSTSTSKSTGGRDDGDDEDEKRHRHINSNDHASDHRGHKKKKSTSSVDDLAVPNPHHHHDEKLSPLSSPIHESVSAPCDINEDISENDTLDDDGPVKPSLQTSTPMIQVPWGGWTTADWRSLAVRGPTYLTSKQKIASKPPMFRLEHVDIVNTNEKIYNIANRPESWFARTYEIRNAAIQKEMAEAAAFEASIGDTSLGAPSIMSRSQSLVTPSTYTTTAAAARRASTIAISEEESKRTDGSDRLRTSSPDFFLIVNFLVPGSPGYNLTCYFSRKRVGKDAKNGDEPADCAVLPGPALTAFNTALNRFVCGSDKYRNTHVKIIPAVVDGGNWLVRNAVGNRPAILGNKLTQTYHTDEKKNYLEIDVDVGSSRVGSSILKVAKSYAKSLTIDISFLIEGQRLDELPEAILGGVRLHHLDLENTLSLAESYHQATNDGKKK